MADHYASRLQPLPAARRAERGALVLDAVVPGWHRRIPYTVRLDQGNGALCVLGQIYGDWRQGLKVLGISLLSYDVIELGFGPHSGWVAPDDNMHLTTAWLAEIARRVAADATGEQWMTVEVEE